MDPATLAMMYAANVGINALGGKRGSNLWKDSFKDTTTQALTMQLTGGFNKGNQFGKVPPVGNDEAVLFIVLDACPSLLVTFIDTAFPAVTLL